MSTAQYLGLLAALGWLGSALVVAIDPGYDTPGEVVGPVLVVVALVLTLLAVGWWMG